MLSCLPVVARKIGQMLFKMDTLDFMDNIPFRPVANKPLFSILYGTQWKLWTNSKYWTILGDCLTLDLKSSGATRLILLTLHTIKIAANFLVISCYYNDKTQAFHRNVFSRHFLDTFDLKHYGNYVSMETIKMFFLVTRPDFIDFFKQESTPWTLWKLA